MIKITKWRPDTCECVIEYAWDNSVPDNQRTHTLDRYVTKCVAHQGKTDNEAYLAITDENPRKNVTLEEIKKAIPSLVETVKDPDGNDVTQFKQGMEPTYSFDANRNLIITLPQGLTTKSKTDAQNAVDVKYSGKVTIN